MGTAMQFLDVVKRPGRRNFLDVSQTDPLPVAIISGGGGGGGSTGTVRGANTGPAVAGDSAQVVTLRDQPAQNNATPDFVKGATVQTTDDLAQNVGAVSTNLAAVDGKDLQSCSLQVNVLSTYTGTLVIEVSNDGTNWITKSLINSNSGALAFADVSTAQTTGGKVVFSGDIGARYIRVRQTAWTAGQVRIVALLDALSTATIPKQTVGLDAGTNYIGNVKLLDSGNSLLESAAPSTAAVAAQRALVVAHSPNTPLPAGTNTLGAVTAKATANHSSDTLNATLLGAGATYTGATVDQTADPTLQGTRVRGVVVHAAGLAFGHLQLQESTDGTTWVETARMPIPSDGTYHGFEFAISLRYYRVNFINGATAQTTFAIRHHKVGTEGESPVGRQNLQFPLTGTALASGATFTSPTLDLGPTHKWSTLRALARSDQSGTLYIQQSKDGTNWFAVRLSDVGVGGTASGTGLQVAAGVNDAAYAEAKIIERYVRVLYANGATAQGTFQLDCALVNL